MITITEAGSFGNEGYGANIQFTNLADFMRKLNLVADEYPKTTEKHLRNIGNLLKRKVSRNTPVGKTAEKYEVKWGRNAGKKRKSKTKLKNSWSGTIVGTSGSELEYQLRSKSKRYHLVERGHYLVFFGKHTNRFVQGKFFFKRTVEEFERSDIVEREMRKMFQEIQRRLEG